MFCGHSVCWYPGFLINWDRWCLVGRGSLSRVDDMDLLNSRNSPQALGGYPQYWELTQFFFSQFNINMYEKEGPEKLSFFWFFPLFFNHRWQCSGLILAPGGARRTIWGCWRSNPSWAHARQAFYLLHYLFSLTKISLDSELMAINKYTCFYIPFYQIPDILDMPWVQYWTDLGPILVSWEHHPKVQR